MNTKISGIFQKYLWRNEKTGASVFIIKTEQSFPFENMYQNKTVRNGIATVDVISLGEIPFYSEGQPLSITGKFQNISGNPKFEQWSFRVDSYREDLFSKEVTATYLKKIGFDDKEEIKKITDALKEGENVYDFFENEENLSEIDIPKTRLEAIRKRLLETKAERETFEWLSRFNVPYMYAHKAVRCFGSSTLEMFKNDPYSVGKRIGLSFKQSDHIGCELGLMANARVRLNGIDEAILQKMYDNGCVYATGREWSDYARGFKRINPTLINEGSVNLSRSVLYKNINGIDCLISKRLYDTEKRVAMNLLRFRNSERQAIDDSIISYAEEQCGIKYGKQQREAFYKILSGRGIKILTGGPGTGKTTTLKGIILAYQKLHPDAVIKLCAPTGRAAQRMSESTQMPATTVHRLIDYRPYGNDYSYKDITDPVNADFLVVDETSMLDIELFDKLLGAIKSDTTVVLVGDTNQLEPVGPGAVLRDLLSISWIENAKLTDVFRQAGGSPIIENSIRIQEGRTEMMEKQGEFDIIECRSGAETLDTAISTMMKFYEPGHPFDTQILCPSKKGDSGVFELNVRLQELLNPAKNTSEEISYGSTKFRVGDKIMMTVNNYEKGYYNGDIGTVVSTRDGKLTVNIRETDIELTRELMDDVDLAYAMTIHKSQGSEFKNTIIVLTDEVSQMLTKNLFYTAVTRAKKNCIVINQGKSMERSIRNKGIYRKTLLNEILSGAVS